MKQIIVDTSTSKSSLILVNNDSPLYEKYWESENNHSKDLYEYFLILKEKLGNIEDLDQITVLLGPGGFNSIRIGISFVLGIASSYNINQSQCTPKRHHRGGHTLPHKGPNKQANHRLPPLEVLPKHRSFPETNIGHTADARD